MADIYLSSQAYPKFLQVSKMPDTLQHDTKRKQQGNSYLGRIPIEGHND
jgi:hypothetical protein